jgi:mycothiol synthase
VTAELRPPRLNDAVELAAAVDEFGRVNDGDRITPAIAETWLGTPSMDLEHDARVVLVDGRIVGYGDVFDSSRQGKLLWLFLAAHPAHEDIWPPLLDFLEDRAAALAAPGGYVKATIPEKASALRAALESRGFAFDRFSFRMVARLDSDVAEPEWPEGVSVRPYRGEEDARPVYKVQEETFSDLEGHTSISYEDWRHWSFRDGFDPGLWSLAFAGGELQGVALCRPEQDGDSSFGWVSVLGVRRPWRGRGLGFALLRHAFRELQARGKTRVGLGVDAENVTGAVRLYERAGMEIVRCRVAYRKAPG